jgi:C-type mannose receptor
MTLIRTVLPAILVAGAATAALAQPVNDSCESPTPITAFGTFSFTTVDATTDGVPNDACSGFGDTQIHPDVWFCWTPVIAGPTRLRACADAIFDTKFAVYEGCTPCPEAGGIIGCDEMGCDLEHRVDWIAELGHSYLIRIGSFDDASVGSGTFRISLPGIVGGPIVNPNNNHTYYLTEPQSWNDAEALANLYGGHLATIRNQDENDWLQATFGFADETFHQFWIGLNDFDTPGTFTWIGGEPVDFTNWAEGQPDNANGDEHAVYFDGFTAHWNDEEADPPSTTINGTIELLPPPPTCPCDWNQDMTLNSQDFFDFLNDFFENNADFNMDEVTNSQDFFDYLTCFFDGC